MSELPEGWTLATLGDLGNYINGRAFKPFEWKKTGLPIVRIQNLTESSGTFNYSDQEHEEKYRLKNGDLLIAWSASLGAFIWNGGNAWLNQHIFRAEADRDIVSKEFLYYTVTYSINALYDKSHGSGMVHVTKPVFESHQTPIPPLNEQRRIVAKLEKLLSRVDAAQARLATIPRILKRFRQSVLAAACSGKLTADWRDANPHIQSADDLLEMVCARRNEWLETAIKNNNREAGRLKNKLEDHSFEIPTSVNIPESWRWSSLLKSCWLVVDCHNKTAPYVKEGIPLVRTTNIKAGRLLTEELKYVSQETYEYWSRRCPPKPGDILFTREAPMGESAMIPNGFQLCMGQRMMLLRVFSDLTDAKYLAYALQDPLFLSRVDENSVGSGVKHLRVGDVESLAIPIPPVTEQQEIVRRVEALFKTADALEARYRTAKAYVDKLTQSILAKAFRGELVPQDPNDEPAEKLLERIRSERKNGAKPPSKGRKQHSA